MSNPDDFSAIVSRRYTADIQLAPVQIEAIAGAIATRGPHCALLVFGVGNDSALWAEINAGGRTLFLEDDATWARRGKDAGLEIEHIRYPTTILGSLTWPDKAITSTEMPALLQTQRWDVILIDGPAGWRPWLPGRALPIAWAARIQDAATHIFLHDYERPLERKFGNRFLLPRGPSAVISAGTRHRHMLWSIGQAAGFDKGPESSGPDIALR